MKVEPTGKKETPDSADASVNVQLELVTVYMQLLQRMKRRQTVQTVHSPPHPGTAGC